INAFQYFVKVHRIRNGNRSSHSLYLLLDNLFFLEDTIYHRRTLIGLNGHEFWNLIDQATFFHLFITFENGAEIGSASNGNEYIIDFRTALFVELIGE